MNEQLIQEISNAIQGTADTLQSFQQATTPAPSSPEEKEGWQLKHTLMAVAGAIVLILLILKMKK